MPIKQKLLQALARYDLTAPGDRLLLGVSGGQDSVTLALALHELAAPLQLSLVIAHLHHGLRAEQADSDLQFVAQLAASLGLPFVSERTDVAALAAAAHLGLEEAGRQARYDFFTRAATAHDCNKIALAHTATDRAETLLINLFRGAGVHGLRAIPPRRDNIIRPLILVSRQQTAEYCRARNISARHDVYNLDPNYLRNRLRADLMPQLERDYGPGLQAALCRAADHVLDELDWTEPLVQQTLTEASDGQALRVSVLQGLLPGLRHRLLRLFLARSGLSLANLGQDRWQALDRLIEKGQTGKKLELQPGHFVVLEYGLLALQGPQTTAPPSSQTVALAVPGCAEAPCGATVQARLTNTRPPLPQAHDTCAIMDADRAGTSLQLRHPRPGDRFTPLGMVGSKKLQDFFVDNKVPPPQRSPLLVTTAAGDILWVVGHRLAAAACLTDRTERYLILTVTEPA